MDDTDDTDEGEFEEGSCWDDDGDTGQKLRRDNLFYLLSEVKMALDRTLHELSHEDAAMVDALLGHLGAKVLGCVASWPEELTKLNPGPHKRTD